MEDVNLRLEFHRALDAVAPPAPWLSAHVKEGLRQRQREGWIDRARQRPPIRIQWMLPVVAALVAVAIVATLVLGATALRLIPSIPGHPFPHLPLLIKSNNPPCGGPGSAGPVEMFGSGAGWAGGSGYLADVAGRAVANGPYRTSDGGVHWIKVAPPAIATLSPDGETEFFLDSTHAWVAEAAGSANATADHVVVFSTRDAGQTWQQSAPLRIVPADRSDVIWSGGEGAHWMCFIDPRDGWLLIESGPWNPMSANWRVGALYRTGDGGLNWTLVSANPGSAALKALNRDCAGVFGIGDGMVFASSTTGWLPLMSCATSSAMLITRDGGATWSVQNEPIAHPELPYFFDSNNGVMFGLDSVAATSDGGISWVSQGARPKQASNVTFADSAHGWCIVNAAPAPGTDWYLYQTTDGGSTWARESSLPTIGGLTFVDTKTGFLAAGQYPGSSDWMLFRTVDGGKSWTRVQSTISP